MANDLTWRSRNGCDTGKGCESSLRSEPSAVHQAQMIRAAQIGRMPGCATRAGR